MYKAICLFITLLLLNVSTFSQNISKLNSSFYNTWVESNYYNELTNCKTPFSLMLAKNNIIQLYFLGDSNMVLLKTHYEGLKRSFIIENSDTIKVLDLSNNESIIYLFNDKDQTKLVLKTKDEILSYVALDKKYYTPNGVNYLINDLFLTGKYISEVDSTIGISFSTNGKVSGIGRFNQYRIPIKGVGLPNKFDIVLLLEVDIKIKNTMVLHWEKTKDMLSLYSVSRASDVVWDGSKYSESEILEKFLELKKTNN